MFYFVVRINSRRWITLPHRDDKSVRGQNNTSKYYGRAHAGYVELLSYDAEQTIPSCHDTYDKRGAGNIIIKRSVVLLWVDYKYHT